MCLNASVVLVTGICFHAAAFLKSLNHREQLGHFFTCGLCKMDEQYPDMTHISQGGKKPWFYIAS